jgi:hypothetical protein
VDYWPGHHRRRWQTDVSVSMRLRPEAFPVPTLKTTIGLWVFAPPTCRRLGETGGGLRQDDGETSTFPYGPSCFSEVGSSSTVQHRDQCAGLSTGRSEICGAVHSHGIEEVRIKRFGVTRPIHDHRTVENSPSCMSENKPRYNKTQEHAPTCFNGPICDHGVGVPAHPPPRALMSTTEATSR